MSVRFRTVSCACGALLWLAASGIWMGASVGAKSPDQLKLGKAVYDRACLRCHGAEGHGDGPEIRRLGFVARDFSLGSFKCRCTPTGDLPTDEDLLRTVSQGLPGSPMPSFRRDLSLEEQTAVVQYIKTLSPRFSQEEPGTCINIPEPPPRLSEMTFEGQQIYRLLSCASCHGETGRGDGPAAAQLTDSWGNPTKVHKFGILRKFKCGNEVRDLYRTLHAGLNGTPMPSYADAFLFARDSWSNWTVFEQTLGSDQTQELKTYVSTQPDQTALGQLSESARQELIERRTWALVAFLKSLVR